MCQLTIFTPTYNRAEYLEKCYQSLFSQDSQDFIWQIVDDGSTDTTEEIVQKFILENRINIEYYKKENGGKASAINYSLDRTKTNFWLCLDSDDYLFPDAVKKILKICEEIKNEKNVCGAFTVRSNKFGAPMAKIDIPLNVLYATQLDIRYKYNVPPEYVQVYKYDVIKDCRFPLFEGEKFITESWMQDRLDLISTFKIFHEPIMVCEYLQDGLTNNYWNLIRNNPLGFLEFYGQRVEICRLFKPRIIAAIMYNAVYERIIDKKIKRKQHWLIRMTILIGKIYTKKLKG